MAVNGEAPTTAKPFSTLFEAASAGAIVNLEFTSGPQPVSAMTEGGKAAADRLLTSRLARHGAAIALTPLGGHRVTLTPAPAPAPAPTPAPAPAPALTLLPPKPGHRVTERGLSVAPDGGGGGGSDTINWRNDPPTTTTITPHGSKRRRTTTKRTT